MSEPSLKNETSESGEGAEASAPRKKGKPFGWSTFVIAVLVFVSCALVWRRDGIDGVWAILSHDVLLFGEIMPRVLGLSARQVDRSRAAARQGVEITRAGIRPQGLLIGTAFGAILPGGPFTAYPVASALLAVGADFGATIAMVVSWTLIGYGRAVAWEMPIMGADFTLWRIVISLPMPILAGALGRVVYVRVRHRFKL